MKPEFINIKDTRNMFIRISEIQAIEFDSDDSDVDYYEIRIWVKGTDQYFDFRPDEKTFNDIKSIFKNL